jgi:repressor LexA
MVNDRLQQVKKFYKKNNRLPSYSEMLELFDVASKNAVFKIVQNWVDEGLLKKQDGKICPTERLFGLPMLGRVKAGFPTAAEEDHEFLSIDSYLIDNPARSFLLKVSGDSLIDIGILPGDTVIIEKRKSANIDDIVLALIDNEWTLKILQKKNGILYLQPANKKYPPLFPENDLQIYGVVKAVIRKF